MGDTMRHRERHDFSLLITLSEESEPSDGSEGYRKVVSLDQLMSRWKSQSSVRTEALNIGEQDLYHLFGLSVLHVAAVEYVHGSLT